MLYSLYSKVWSWVLVYWTTAISKTSFTNQAEPPPLNVGNGHIYDSVINDNVIKRLLEGRLYCRKDICTAGRPFVLPEGHFR